MAEIEDAIDIISQNIAFSLVAIGYPRECDASSIVKWVNGADLLSNQYVECVSWLSSEIGKLCKLEECVHEISGPDDEEGFGSELGSFLRELKCPYISMQSRLLPDPFSRLEILNYLCTELLALRSMQKMEKGRLNAETKETPVDQLSGTLAMMDVEPKSIEISELLSRTIENVKQRVTQEPRVDLGEPLFCDQVSAKQMSVIHSLIEKMELDYQIRAKMLLERLDVTVQSFSWSDRLKGRKEEILGIYSPIRQQLTTKWRIGIADILAARNDLTYIEKTCGLNLSGNSECNLRRLTLIGVGPPDRGGRPKDVLKMPQWRQRVVEGGGGPQRERYRRKKNKTGEETKRGPSGSVSMTKRSQKKSKRGAEKEGMEIDDASQL